MTQQVGKAQHGPTYNGPYIYIGSVFLVAGHSKHLAGPMPCCKYASVSIIFSAYMVSCKHYCKQVLLLIGA